MRAQQIKDARAALRLGSWGGLIVGALWLTYLGYCLVAEGRWPDVNILVPAAIFAVGDQSHRITAAALEAMDNRPESRPGS